MKMSIRFIFPLLSLMLFIPQEMSWALAKKDIAQSPTQLTDKLSEKVSDHSHMIKSWCDSVIRESKGFKWNIDPCRDVNWQVGGLSVEGRPLVYAAFGDPQAENTSLVLTAVHGDEVTPFYLGIRLVEWLRENQSKLKNTRVILAPLVNPDGLFARPRTRVNARGVDVNRNFGTKDWSARAHSAWRVRFRSDPRRNPGKKPGSEPETIFQEQLIHRVKPKKILSIHAPLNFLDYDGPSAMSLARFPKEYVQECLKLRSKLKAISGGFYPGSLGNFAGQELGIPTLTLELPSADPAKAESYWKLFNQGIQVMIEYIVPKVDLSMQST